MKPPSSARYSRGYTKAQGHFSITNATDVPAIANLAECVRLARRKDLQADLWSLILRPQEQDKSPHPGCSLHGEHQEGEQGSCIIAMKLCFVPRDKRFSISVITMTPYFTVISVKYDVIC